MVPVYPGLASRQAAKTFLVLLIDSLQHNQHRAGPPYTAQVHAVPFVLLCLANTIWMEGDCPPEASMYARTQALISADIARRPWSRQRVCGGPIDKGLTR
jgi:hypothetical protein